MQFEYKGKTYEVKQDAGYLYELSKVNYPPHYVFDIDEQNNYIYICSWLDSNPPQPYGIEKVAKGNIEKSTYIFHATEVTKEDSNKDFSLLR